MTIKSADLSQILFQKSFADGTYSVSHHSGYDVLTADLSGLTLTAGNYNLGFYDPANMAVASWYGGPNRMSQDGNFYTGDVAIEITSADSAVPEPASLALVGLAFGALALSRRKQR